MKNQENQKCSEMPQVIWDFYINTVKEIIEKANKDEVIDPADWAVVEKAAGLVVEREKAFYLGDQARQMNELKKSLTREELDHIKREIYGFRSDGSDFRSDLVGSCGVLGEHDENEPLGNAVSLEGFKVGIRIDVSQEIAILEDAQKSFGEVIEKLKGLER